MRRTLPAALAAVLVALAPSARAGEDACGSGPGFLPPGVGETLSAALPAAGAVLPADWQVGPVRVEARRIVVEVLGPGGASAVAVLSAPAVPGRGRWFDAAIERLPRPAPEGLRPALEALALRIDGAFSADPWSRACEARRAPPPPAAGPPPRDSRLRLPADDPDDDLCREEGLEVAFARGPGGTGWRLPAGWAVTGVRSEGRALVAEVASDDGAVVQVALGRPGGIPGGGDRFAWEVEWVSPGAPPSAALATAALVLGADAGLDRWPWRPCPGPGFLDRVVSRLTDLTTWEVPTAAGLAFAVAQWLVVALALAGALCGLGCVGRRRD